MTRAQCEKLASHATLQQTAGIAICKDPSQANHMQCALCKSTTALDETLLVSSQTCIYTHETSRVKE